MNIPAELNPLPRVFIQPVLSKRSIQCSTLELNSLSDRADEAVNQIIAITNNLIKMWLERIKEDIESLFRLTDSFVSLNDSLLSVFYLRN